ncbi:MAG: hypothetical protein IJ196_04990 [Prevotella sp.]|nr:hypothetical protein [Prevotella sp.]
MEKSSRRRSEERIAGAVFVTMIAVTAMVFSAFFLVKYNTPWSLDPDFNAPAMTDVLIGYAVTLTAAALLLTLLSVGVASLNGGKRSQRHNGVPAMWLAIGVFVALAVLLSATFLLGSPSAIMVNGRFYGNTLWLRTADMFVTSSLVLLLTGAVAVACNYLFTREK